jgi:hypothetical protein
VRALFEQAVAAAPTEPHYRFLAAMFAIVTNDFGDAARHLERALEREYGGYRRALLLLWHARVLAADGRPELSRSAEPVWRALAEADPTPDGVAGLQALGETESRRPVSRLRLRNVVPDVFLVDAALPGRS